MKKFVSFLLTLAMLLSLSVTAFADETSAGITVSVNSSGPAQDGSFEIKLENPTFQITTPGVVEGRTLSWTGGDDLVEFEQINIINSNDTMVFQLSGKIKDNGSTKVTFTTSDEKSTTIDLKVNLPTVTFLDEDDTVLYKSIVVGSKVASMPENPTKEGKNFIGWWFSYEKTVKGKTITKDGWLNETTTTDSGKLNTVHAKWEDAPNATPVATVGNDSYDTVEAAAVAVADDTEITINEATTIGNITVEAGSTVTAKTETAAAATNNAATVTPKTLTISKNGEETKTVKAYVVSGGTGDEAKSTVVTNVAKDSSVVNETNSGDVSDYVNVAQVLANAATGSKKDGEAATFDASSITGMELSLITKNTNNAGTVTNQTLQAAIDDVNVTVFDVYPLAKVTTKTTVEGTTSTETYEYDASNDLATGATFTFRLPVGNGLDAGKTAKLTHYHQEESGEWSTETIYGIVDQYGLVTVTLDKFSYITVDGLEYEVCGTITDMTLVVGSDNKLVYTFALNEAGKALSNPQVKLKIEGKDDYLEAKSEAEFNASDKTVYTVSENNGVYTLKVKIFAKYMNAKVSVELWDGDSQKAIESYSRSQYTVEGYDSYKTAQTGLTFGYSLVEYLGYYAGVSRDSNYSALYTAMVPYAQAAAAWR